MRKNIIAVGGVLMAVAIMISAGFVFNSNSVNDTGVSAVKWMTFEEAIEAQKTEPRLVFVDVYTDWCGWCKKMDAGTFNQSDVAKLLNENKLDEVKDLYKKSSINLLIVGGLLFLLINLNSYDMYLIIGKKVKPLILDLIL